MAGLKANCERMIKAHESRHRPIRRRGSGGACRFEAWGQDRFCTGRAVTCSHPNRYRAEHEPNATSRHRTRSLRYKEPRQGAQAHDWTQAARTRAHAPPAAGGGDQHRRWSNDAGCRRCFWTLKNWRPGSRPHRLLASISTSAATCRGNAHGHGKTPAVLEIHDRLRLLGDRLGKRPRDIAPLRVARSTGRRNRSSGTSSRTSRCSRFTRLSVQPISASLHCATTRPSLYTINF